MKSHKDLDVWHAAAINAPRTTNNDPRTYGIISQMRRSAVSIASNIAEGAARQGNKEFIQFLYVALGSASELDTQIEVSKEIGLGDTKELLAAQQKLESISRMIQGLIRSVKNSTNH